MSARAPGAVCTTDSRCGTRGAGGEAPWRSRGRTTGSGFSPRAALVAGVSMYSQGKIRAPPAGARGGVGEAAPPRAGAGDPPQPVRGDAKLFQLGGTALALLLRVEPAAGPAPPVGDEVGPAQRHLAQPRDAGE